MSRPHQSRPRGRPPKNLTADEFLRRFGHKALVWCDENGEPVADQTKPTEYIRPLTKAEQQERVVTEILEASEEFERCDEHGNAEPAGTRWRLREPF